MPSKNGTANVIELDFGSGLPPHVNVTMGTEKKHVISTDFDPVLVARAGRWLTAWSRHVNAAGERPSADELMTITAEVLGIDMEEARGYQFAAHFKLAGFLQRPFDMTGVMTALSKTRFESPSPSAED